MKKIGKIILLVTLLVSILNYNLLVSKATTFKDIDNDFWAKEEVDWSIDNKVVVGFPDGTFRPNQQVTEAQFMSMIHRYLKLGSLSSESTTDKKTEDTKEKPKSPTIIDESNKSNKSVEAVSTNEPNSYSGIYSELREIGIMAAGTNYPEVRERVINQEDAAAILLSAFTDEKYITDKERIVKFLKDVGLSEGDQFEVGKPLTRLSAVSLLKAFHEKGGTLNTDIELDKELGFFELHYFGDWNDRIFYFYPDSGLIVSVTEVEENFEKEQSYYESIRGKKIQLKEGKNNYLINISSIHGTGLDFYGYAVFMVDNSGTKTVEERKGFIGLRGNSQLTTVVSGDNVKDIKIVLGKNIIPIAMDNLKAFPGNRFYSDRGYGLEWNLFYLGEEVTDTFDQVERHLYKYSQ